MKLDLELHILRVIIYLLLIIKNKKKSLILISIVLICFYTFRVIESIDDLGYQTIFNYIKAGYKVDYIEKTFLYIVKFNLLFSDNITITYFIYASISFLILYKVVKEVYITKVDLFIYFTYFTFFMVMASLTLMRQFLAISIVSYAFVLSKNNNRKNAFLLIVLASFFHKSALFVLPFIWIINIKFNPIFLIVFIFSGILLGEIGFPNRIINLFSELGIYTEYSNPEQILIYKFGTLTISLLFFGILNLILQSISQKKTLKGRHYQTNLWVMYIFIFSISTNSGWASRISLYFFIFIPTIFIQIKDILISKDDYFRSEYDSINRKSINKNAENNI